MTDKTRNTTSFHPAEEARQGRRQRQLRWPLLAMAAILALAACNQNPRQARYLPYVDPEAAFVGGIAADEPRAALAGREILKRGGSAADAVTAAFFTLTATYPVAASPAAFGACIVYDPTTKRSQTLDFLARPAANGAIATPLAARAFGLLQGRYGTLRWEETLSGAEAVARFGIPASRAYARALATTPDDLRGAPSLAPMVAGGIGRTLEEGQTFHLPELAALLLRLRVAGVGDMHQGQASRLLQEDAAALGVALSADELRAALPVWGDPVTLPAGRLTVLVGPGQGGAAFARAWPQLAAGSSWSLFGSDDRAPWARLPEALRSTYPVGAPADDVPTGSTGLAAFDKKGQAVACTVSLGRPFGIGQAGRQSGVILAAPPQPAATFDTAVLAVNTDRARSHLAATGTGGPRGSAALVQAVMDVVAGRTPAPTAVATPRLYPGAGGEIGSEPNLPDGIRAQLGATTLTAEPAPISRLNMLACNGLPAEPQTCRFATDGRGFGLALGDSFVDESPSSAKCNNPSDLTAFRACEDVSRRTRTVQ